MTSATSPDADGETPAEHEPAADSPAPRSPRPSRAAKDRRASLLEMEKKRRLHCCPWYIPKRLIMVVLCFLGMFVIHAMRVNVAVAVVTLTDETVHAKVGTPKAVANVSITFSSLL